MNTPKENDALFALVRRPGGWPGGRKGDVWRVDPLGGTAVRMRDGATRPCDWPTLWEAVAAGTIRPGPRPLQLVGR